MEAFYKSLDHLDSRRAAARSGVDPALYEKIEKAVNAAVAKATGKTPLDDMLATADPALREIVRTAMQPEGTDGRARSTARQYLALAAPGILAQITKRDGESPLIKAAKVRAVELQKRADEQGGLLGADRSADALPSAGESPLVKAAKARAEAIQKSAQVHRDFAM